jgi:cellulase
MTNTCTGGKLDFTIPKGIAPGDYLLRAEAIALHAASTSGGAEHYVTCYQLTVSGDGTLVPKGVKFPEAYKTDGPGLGFNIHAPISEYPAPGPALIAGGTEATPQLSTFGELSGAPPAATGAASEPAASSTEASEVASSTPAAVSSSATVEAEATSAATVEVSSAIEVSSVATSIVETSSVVEVSSVAASTAEAVPTEAAPVESEVAPTPTPQLSSVGPYPVVNSTSMLVGTGAPVVASSSIVVSAVPTTMATSVRPAPTGEATGPILEYYQCGGQNFKGTGECAEGLECKQWNPFYFQCVKPEATKPGPSKGPMPSSAVPVVSTPTAEAPKPSGVAAEPTVEAPKPTVEAPKPTAEASKPAAEATTPTSAAPVSATPAAAEPSSAAPTGDDETTEKTYTLETFIAFLEQEAGSESAAMIRRMIEALQN